MRRRLTILTAYFSITPLLLLFLILYVLSLSHTKSQARLSALNLFQQNAQFQALPEDRGQHGNTEVLGVDVREQLLEEFLAKYQSPLLPHTHHLIETADKYKLDYRLLPAIAMQESNLCKKIPKNSAHNCWGFGIYGKKRTGFDNYEQAISVVAKGLSENYVQIGLVTPEEIMTKYTPGSNGSWANSVNYFMNKIHSL